MNAKRRWKMSWPKQTKNYTAKRVWNFGIFWFRGPCLSEIFSRKMSPLYRSTHQPWLKSAGIFLGGGTPSVTHAYSAQTCYLKIVARIKFSCNIQLLTVTLFCPDTEAVPRSFPVAVEHFNRRASWTEPPLPLLLDACRMCWRGVGHDIKFVKASHEICALQKKNTLLQLWDRRFRPRSSLEAMYGTPTARTIVCVYPHQGYNRSATTLRTACIRASQHYVY